MEKEKVLEIKIERINDEYSAWCITYQNEEILKRGKFMDEELGVCSRSYPSFDICTKVLYIKGEDESGDNTVNVIPNYLAGRLKGIVDKLNEEYGVPKRWRANLGEKYHCIGTFGNVECQKETCHIVDTKRCTLGNYFKTQEEAEKVANSKEYKDFWAKVRAGEIGGEE